MVSILLSNIKRFICTQLNGFKDCYQAQIVFSMHNELFFFCVSLPNTSHFIRHYLLVCTLLINFKYGLVIQITWFDSHLLIGSKKRKSINNSIIGI